MVNPLAGRQTSSARFCQVLPDCQSAKVALNELSRLFRHHNKSVCSLTSPAPNIQSLNCACAYLHKPMTTWPHLFAGVLCAHNLQQGHHMGGAEEVGANNTLLGGGLCGISGGGRGRQDTAHR
jgi:hypothetical protein